MMMSLGSFYLFAGFAGLFLTAIVFMVDKK